VNTWLHPRFLPKRMPVVATLHHSIHHPDLKPYKGWLRSVYHERWIAPIERRTMYRADKVIAVSLFAAETARRTLVDRPVEVIYNGVDVKRFKPPMHRPKRRPFRLLYVGKWVPLKGVDLLAPIMGELGDDFELRYTGGAGTTSPVERPSNMHDVGRLSGAAAVVEAMQDADAFLFPSRTEGFPLVAIEALACGLPIIATRGSSLEEAVEDGVSGILCGQGDVAAMAAACRKLAGDLGACGLMATAARARALRHFAMDQMVVAYIQAYLSLSGAAGNKG
jgi:glycosyltransferase involved in cell wall biosynthesis